MKFLKRGNMNELVVLAIAVLLLIGLAVFYVIRKMIETKSLVGVQ